MVDKNKIIKVTNRDNGTVGYTIPDLGNLHRNFQSGETKEVTMEELKKLSYIPGGETILKNYLIVHDEEALSELIPEVEPEYFYTEEEVKELLLTGSMDQFLDCLDFAPDGVIELIKHLAVKLEVNDIKKREAILKKTGFNVTRAVEVNKETEKNEDIETQTRRATPISVNVQDVAATPSRRTDKNIITIIKK